MVSRWYVVGFFLWMNILHVVSKKREVAPAIKKLQSTCQGTSTCPVTYPKEDLRERLDSMQYHVTQEKGTERAYSGKFLSAKDQGVYTCVVCGNKIFSSDDKYNSHCGWPAFKNVVDHTSVTLADDTSHGMTRVEVTCSCCGAHLGHVFDDGPLPTGKRFCINSAALDFKKSESCPRPTLKPKL